MNPTRFSVIVPTFNRAPQLERLLESLAAQTLPATEVIVADDGSTDATPAVVERFAEKVRLRHVFQANRGPAAARNHGAREAHEEMLAFIDSDCVAAPGWLAALAGARERDPDTAMFFGQVRSSAPPMAPFIHAFDLRGQAVPGGNLLVRADLFRSLGGFDERLRYAEDSDFAERVRAAGIKPQYVPEAWVEHPPSVRPWSIWGRPPPAWATLRYLYRKHPHKRLYESSPLRVFVRSGIKLAALVALWPWLGGWSLLVGWGLLSLRGAQNVLRAARAAAAATPPLRLVPRNCAAYIVFGWLGDFVEVVSYLRSLGLELPLPEGN